jgi:hypothetical protein
MSNNWNIGFISSAFVVLPGVIEIGYSGWKMKRWEIAEE